MSYRNYMASLLLILWAMKNDGVFHDPVFSFVPPVVLVQMQNKGPVVEWTDGKEYDFGEVSLGTVKGIIFHFKNVGSDSLLLETVRTTCGCTAADWKSDPIAPGASGLLKIEYSADQSGPFRKKIRVFFNRQRKPEILWVYGEVGG